MTGNEDTSGMAPRKGSHSQFMADIIALEDRFRNAPEAEADYILLNETKSLVPFSFSFIAREGKVVAIGGVDRVGKNGERTEIYRKYAQGRSEGISLADGPEDGEVRLAPKCLSIRYAEDTVVFGGDGFSEIQARTLFLMVRCAYDCRTLQRKKHFRLKPLAICIGIAVCLALLFPVHSATYATGEVDVQDALVLRSEIPDTVKSVLVEPNTIVHQGQVLAVMDDHQAKADLDVATHAQQAAESAFEEASQQGMDGDGHTGAQIQVLKDRIEGEKAKVQYQKYLLGRIIVRAPRDGIVMFSDKASLEGKYMQPGEALMTLSSPNSNRLKIFVPVQDVTTFSRNAPVRFYDNLDPLHRHTGKLVDAGYLPQTRPDSHEVYIDRADMNGMSLRPGIQGTAEIIGARRPLVLWLFRKPLAAIRPWMPF